MIYYKRNIDKKLLEWKVSQRRKPLLIRGARQVGKSSAVRQLGKEFKYFVEINLESQPSIRGLFSKDIDVHRTCEGISATTGIPVIPGETLLFIDEIQVSQEAIMSLRYFKRGLSGTACHSCRLFVGIYLRGTTFLWCGENTFAIYVPFFL